MKYVLLNTDNSVAYSFPEVDEHLGKNATELYSTEFLDGCLLIDDSIDALSGFIYDSYTKQFIEPERIVITEPVLQEPVPTETELMQQNITVLQLAVAELAETAEAQDIANKLAIAELAEATMGGES